VDPLSAPRLIFDLQQANQVAQRIYGCLDAQTIATEVTQGLVEQFGCALARIWLVEPPGHYLKLVASSGLYTRTDGSFSRVPMGAFKVGKIAQNRVSFLSNNLPNEPWVKDRDWALEHQIQGFAGYPLATPETVVGVLALFSREPLAPEFLEVLLSLCTTATVALGNALAVQQAAPAQPIGPPMLSDRLAQILGPIPLKLVGTERSLDLSLTYLFLSLTERIERGGGITCGLTYGPEVVVVNAIVPADPPDPINLDQLQFASACLGGSLETTLDPARKIRQIALQLPYGQPMRPVRVACRSALLQSAFTHMVPAAGFCLDMTPTQTTPQTTPQTPTQTPIQTPTQTTPLITDCSSLIQASQAVIWVQPSPATKRPQGIQAQVTLETDAAQLREAIEAVLRGETWGLTDALDTQKMLSEREQDVMTLLSQGQRDREIASALCISESTVKFHITNTLAKLQAKTRIQALYELMHNGWLG
jgi:DNA-binding CsgD family transcriptional regulator